MASRSAGRWRQGAGLLLSRRWVVVTVAVLAVLFLVYTLAGFFLVPRLIATYVPRYAHDQLGRRAEIGEVRVNPLLFKVDIRQFRLQEADGRPLLGFDRLFVDFELTSAFRAAWTFAEIRLEGPRVDAVIAPDGRVNIAELLDALPKGEPAPEPAAPRRVLLHHAVVSDGVVSFTDRSHRAPQTATVQPINIELHDVTTLPDRRGPYTVAATLAGGGVVSWDGQVSLVPVASTGRLDFRGFPLATAWRFVQESVAVAEPTGQLDAKLRYEFAYRDGAPSLKVDGVEVAVTDLTLKERTSKAPLLALDRMNVTAARGDVIARELTVPEVSVSRGRVAATLARDGTVNWQTAGHDTGQRRGARGAACRSRRDASLATRGREAAGGRRRAVLRRREPRGAGCRRRRGTEPWALGAARERGVGPDRRGRQPRSHPRARGGPRGGRDEDTGGRARADRSGGWPRGPRRAPGGGVSRHRERRRDHGGP